MHTIVALVSEIERALQWTDPLLSTTYAPSLSRTGRAPSVTNLTGLHIGTDELSKKYLQLSGPPSE